MQTSVVWSVANLFPNEVARWVRKVSQSAALDWRKMNLAAVSKFSQVVTIERGAATSTNVVHL
jgi:hypothetical protein